MKRMKRIKPIAFAISLLLLSSCATLFKGRYQEITINSNVSGALVEMDGVELGYTPYTGKIRKGKRDNIKVSKPGYITGSVDLERNNGGGYPEKCRIHRDAYHKSMVDEVV